MYNSFYQLSKGEQKAVNDLIKKLEIKSSIDEQKVRAVENWTKTEISISDAITNNPALDEIIEYKQTSKSGATRYLLLCSTILTFLLNLC